MSTLPTGYVITIRRVDNGYIVTAETPHYRSGHVAPATSSNGYVERVCLEDDLIECVTQCVVRNALNV